MKRLITLLLNIGIIIGFTASLTNGSELNRATKCKTPVVKISSETIDILTEAGKDYSSLEVDAIIDGLVHVTGYVNENYKICFDNFPSLWRKTLISVKCTDGGVFGKSLITFFRPKGIINPVTTAAAIACGQNPLKYYPAELRLGRAVKKVGSGELFPKKVRLTKMVLITALISQNIITDELNNDIDAYLGPDAPLNNIKISIPDFETGITVHVAGCEFAPNQFGIGTNQGQEVLPRGGRPFMLENPLRIGPVIENPFHAHLRERAAHNHLDIFIDLDSGTSRILPENTLPEGFGWDICVKHLRDGWPYIRLNYINGVAGSNVGPVDWESFLDASDVTLYHGPDNPGILIIAHGEPAPEWNLAVDKAVDRIKVLHPRYADLPVELAFLEDDMVEEDPRNEQLGLTDKSIVDALGRLRAEGVEWVGAIPLMVNNCSSHIEEIRWLMGQSVEALTSEWQGNLNDAGSSFKGFIGQKGPDLSGEMVLAGFDEDVPEVEGGFGGTVDDTGALNLEGRLSGYSADGLYYCEVTLSDVTGTHDSAFNVMSGAYTGAWKKEQLIDDLWVFVGEGELAGDWILNKTEEGKPDLSGLEISLGSAVEGHPFMQDIQKARINELIDGNEPADMGLALGVHGADVLFCDEPWRHMGEEILESVFDEMPFAATNTAFIGEIADTLTGYIDDYGTGNAALSMHMIAPGSLTQAMPFIVGWPNIMPGVDYLYNQKALLAYKNQEEFNLPYPPFSQFPSLTAGQLSGLILDETSDLFVDWMARHSLELVSAYPVGDNWHGKKKPDQTFDMTNNVYVIKTDRHKYVKMRVFSAGRCLISLEYCCQTIPEVPGF